MKESGGNNRSIDRAIQFSALAHRNQVRKGTDIPYITHPYGVAMILCRAGCPEEAVIAGLLHDTTEDTSVTLEDIRKEFGDRVASIVEGCSEPDKSLPWEKRKKHTLEFLKGAPLLVKFVALADKLDNIRAIAADLNLLGEKVWEKFRRGRQEQKWYYQGLEKALREDSGNETYERLYRQFAQEVDNIFENGR